MHTKEKQLKKLRKEIIEKIFIKNWRDVWFYPEYDGVKGWLGVKEVIFIGSNPSFNVFPTRYTDFFYEQLKENRFNEAHLTDLIKIRSKNKDADKVIEENTREQKLFLSKEINIVQPKKIVIMGARAKFYADKFTIKEYFYMPHYSSILYSSKNKDLFIEKMKELRRIIGKK